MTSQRDDLLPAGCDRPRTRGRRVVVSLGLALASIGTGALTSVAGPAPTVAADELPVNELAPEITDASTKALAALDAFAASGDPADERLAAWHRGIAARYTARQLGYDEYAMVDAWSRVDLAHQRAVLGALSQVGVPYRRNTSNPGVGFDCSGLTTYAWAQGGVDIFRQSGVQINESARRDRETAVAGDLVHYPGHIMMYLGVGDAIVHSVRTGRTVEIDTISARRANSVRWGDPSASS